MKWSPFGYLAGLGREIPGAGRLRISGQHVPEHGVNRNLAGGARLGFGALARNDVDPSLFQIDIFKEKTLQIAASHAGEGQERELQLHPGSPRTATAAPPLNWGQDAARGGVFPVYSR